MLSSAALALALAASASAAPKTQLEAGSSCGASSLQAHSADLYNSHGPSGLGAGGAGIDLAKIIKEKAAGYFANKGISLAFDAASKLFHLDKILPESPEDKILAELEQIKAQLAEIQQTLNVLTEKVDQAIAEARTKNFNDILSALCVIYGRQKAFYTDYYQPLVVSTAKLGDIEKKLGAEGITEKERDQLEAELPAAKALVRKRQENFRDNYNTAGGAQEADDMLIHQRLLPGGLSVLTAYGEMAMTKRFLTRKDSESIRALYEEFAQVEALASWMAAEYHATPEDECEPTDLEPECVQNRILKRYLDHTEAEQKKLPRMIPEGAVIDLGEMNATSASEKPMWLVPTGEGQCWLPHQHLSWLHRYGEYLDCSSEDPRVGQTMAALNARGDLPGHDWVVPTRVQLTALMSKDCLADPAHPESYLPGKKCASPLGGKQNTRIGDYLTKLEPQSPAWVSAFCTTGSKYDWEARNESCMEPLHHVWTKEKASAKLKCGAEVLGAGKYYNKYQTYTGWDLYGSSLNRNWGYFPGLGPQFAETSGYETNLTSTEEHSGLTCDRFVYEYFNGMQGHVTDFSQWRLKKFGSTGPAPPRMGALIATRYTGSQDLHGGVDYMDQPTGG